MIFNSQKIHRNPINNLLVIATDMCSNCRALEKPHMLPLFQVEKSVLVSDTKESPTIEVSLKSFNDKNY